MTHGLYANSLSGKAREALQEIQSMGNAAVLQKCFEMIHARLEASTSGEVRLSARFAKLYGIAEVMAEDGEFDLEDLKELKLRLAGVDLEKIVRIGAGSVTIANAAHAHGIWGDATKQIAILRSGYVDILRDCEDLGAKRIALGIIARLKLEAGLPVEQMNAMLQAAQGTDNVDT